MLQQHDTQNHHRLDNPSHALPPHPLAPPPGGQSTGRNPAGGRKRIAPHYLAEAQADAFEGLPPGVSPHAIVDLLEQAGAGGAWTGRLISHFKLLVSYTRPQDWECGQRPIVWLTVREAADRLRLSESQVRRNETALMRLGALAFRDSGNHRRFGHRGGDGYIAAAYGLDLSPAAALLPELTLRAEVLADHRAEWHRLRHAISAARRGVRAALDGALADRRIADKAAEPLLTEIAKLGVRVRGAAPLDTLRRRLARLEEIDALLGVLATGEADTGEAELSEAEPGDPPPAGVPDPSPAEPSGKDDVSSHMLATASVNACPGKHPCEPPLDYNTKDSLIENTPVAGGRRKGGTGSGGGAPPGKAAGAAAAPSPDGGPPVKVSFDALLTLVPAPMRAWLPPDKHVSWSALIEAAAAHAGELGISKHAWGEACRTLGRQAAATAVIVIAAKHERDLIDAPGGYLRALTGRAAAGELHLARSVYGLLDAAPNSAPDRHERKEARHD